VTWPYHFYYFDKDETSIFAEGLATVMRDDQTTINSANRLMLDNAAITSGPMLEITSSLLSGYDKNNAGAAPWRVYSRNASSPGTPAVRAIELPSIPRYMTGENVSQGAAGTASGMSMLMGAANIMIKDLVSSWDEGITRSFIQGMYRWNMQFNKDNSIKGDFDVKARGSSSLVAREVRAQQLDMFSQAVANPMDAPFIKRDKLLRQRAEAHELTDVVKTEDEVAAEQNNQMAQQQQQMAMQQAQLAMSELGQKVALLWPVPSAPCKPVVWPPVRRRLRPRATRFCAVQVGRMQPRTRAWRNWAGHQCRLNKFRCRRCRGLTRVCRLALKRRGLNEI